ncbi:hypothetical protein [Streptomyces caeruleatus]|uniref:Integrase n=1 Tax=Streptomyces caeruleatus TaxID=661399 RepID=A0A101TDT6_9ACTN|nr:hypothetical protein [Streptomyces caeruleatus]KUN90428.1 hypothetical protein AQJ67_44120 [Streptomyces caeruleatus]
MDGLVVRCIAEDGSAFSDYRFGDLPVAEGLRQSLAEAFNRRTAPGAGLASLESMTRAYRAAVVFARYLSTLAWPPTEVSHLLPEHLDGFIARRKDTVSRTAGDELAEVKRLLKRAEGLSEAMTAKLGESNPKRPRRESPKESYSAQEFKRIAAAARADLRAAAARIRKNREVLRRFRQGEDLGGDRRRLELLDLVDRFGDVPRRPGTLGRRTGQDVVKRWVFRYGPIDDLVCQLHLSGMEVTAGFVLLTAMTGQNKSVLLKTPAVHHRADGYAGATPTAMVGAHKPRRGRRAHISLALSDLPDWISIPSNLEEVSARDELHTPFGLYLLLHELTSRSRELTGTDRLMIGWSSTGGGSVGRGLRQQTGDRWIVRWARGHGLTADKSDAEGHPVPLTVTMQMLRLTYVELHQTPVAHTEQTLATDYLARNRGNLAAYRKVVAEALEEEVAKARVRGVMARLTRTDLERARTDAAPVADEYGIDATTLRRMIAGELDTVMNACVDHLGGPHAPPGEPCRASFMLCLGCPCARALPRHLPLQVLVHDRLAERRSDMTPMQWTQRFALAHSQLADLVSQHDEADVADARANIADADRAVVARFLNRELDLR